MSCDLFVRIVVCMGGSNDDVCWLVCEIDVVLIVCVFNYLLYDVVCVCVTCVCLCVCMCVCVPFCVMSECVRHSVMPRQSTHQGRSSPSR